MDFLQKHALEFMFAILATAGGVSRYLNAYIQGGPFNIGMFFASAIVSGFSGYMFALIGVSINLPQPMLYVMAGTGGFFGDQALKFAFEYVSNQATNK